jgi:hypothetical protein
MRALDKEMSLLDNNPSQDDVRKPATANLKFRGRKFRGRNA